MSLCHQTRIQRTQNRSYLRHQLTASIKCVRCLLCVTSHHHNSRSCNCPGASVPQSAPELKITCIRQIRSESSGLFDARSPDGHIRKISRDTSKREKEQI